MEERRESVYYVCSPDSIKGHQLSRCSSLTPVEKQVHVLTARLRFELFTSHAAGLWLDFYSATEQSAPCSLRHKAAHIKREQHKEVGAEGGVVCDQKVALSRLLYKNTRHAP